MNNSCAPFMAGVIASDCNRRANTFFISSISSARRRSARVPVYTDRKRCGTYDDECPRGQNHPHRRLQVNPLLSGKQPLPRNIPSAARQGFCDHRAAKPPAEPRFPGFAAERNRVKKRPKCTIRPIFYIFVRRPRTRTGYRQKQIIRQNDFFLTF